MIREKGVLVVDDNLIGTRPEHVARAKDLFRAMIEADLRKEWIAQVTINFADDEELMALAAKGRLQRVFIGFESPTPEGLSELGKKFNLAGGRDFRASVRRIQRHKILVVGSFIIGLDIDGPGIGSRVAEAASRYGVNNLNALFLTPIPGTRLWDQMKAEDRIVLNEFPEDWQYYTMGFPVARYKHLSHGREHRRSRALQPALLLAPADRSPRRARPVGPPPASERSGDQPRVPQQRPTEHGRARDVQARAGKQEHVIRQGPPVMTSPCRRRRLG